MLVENAMYHAELVPDDCQYPRESTETVTTFDVVSLEPYAKMFSIGIEVDAAPLFCTPAASIMGPEIGWFRALGLPVDVFTQSPASLDHLMSNGACWSMVIVDCDSFGGIECVLEQLRREIKTDLKVPFILVSSHCGSAVSWGAQAPTVSTLLADKFSIDTMEETVFAVLGDCHV